MLGDKQEHCVVLTLLQFVKAVTYRGFSIMNHKPPTPAQHGRSSVTIQWCPSHFSDKNPTTILTPQRNWPLCLSVTCCVFTEMTSIALHRKGFVLTRSHCSPKAMVAAVNSEAEGYLRSTACDLGASEPAGILGHLCPFSTRH